MKKYLSYSLITSSCSDKNRTCSTEKVSNKMVASYINGEKFEFHNVLDLQEDKDSSDYEDLMIHSFIKPFLNGNNGKFLYIIQ